MELRELLRKHEYDGDGAPVGRVAGFPAAHEGERWMVALDGFFGAVQQWMG
jgi:translation elongation factor EF-Tu-like GTPase